MYNTSWGYLVPGRPENLALLSPSLVQSPTTGSMEQTSMPNMFPTSSGQLHLQINPLSLLNFELHYLVSSVQSLSRVRLFATPWIAACQASLSITNSQSSARLKSIESVMPSRHLILWRPLLLLPPIPPSIRVFSNESAFRMRWPKYWSFSFSIIPSREMLISFRISLVSLPLRQFSWVKRLSFFFFQ